MPRTIFTSPVALISGAGIGALGLAFLASAAMSAGLDSDPYVQAGAISNSSEVRQPTIGQLCKQPDRGTDSPRPCWKLDDSHRTPVGIALEAGPNGAEFHVVNADGTVIGALTTVKAWNTSGAVLKPGQSLVFHGDDTAAGDQQLRIIAVH